MWETFPPDKVGIPVCFDGGKLLLTTRLHKVCRGMKCQRIVKVEPLSTEESWDLFVEQLGYCEGDFSSELEGIAKSVANECGGLPLALITVAASMRGMEEISEWRNALNELREPSRKGLNNDMENEVFKLLKFSYDRLADERLQQCLLYCSLFPEDFKINKYFLMVYWIGEGLIDEMQSRQAEIDRGNAIINRLIDACLLESVKSYKVKMHDVIRGMALVLVRQNPMFMVKARVDLQDFPSEWSMNLDRVSLTHNHLELWRLPNLTPNCPSLKTLFLQYNYNLKELPHCFFSNMPMLTILDMSNSGMEKLPVSITNLKSLRVLLLNFCNGLTHIPSLGGLENLRELDLSYSSIEQLPDGLERLTNLRVLNLSSTKLKGLFPSAVLQQLTNLQVLYFYHSEVCVEAEALINLRKLERMSVKFADIATFNCYVKSQHWQRLSIYDIVVGTSPENPFDSDNKRVLICGKPLTLYSVGAEMGKTPHPLFPRNMDELGIYDYDLKGGAMSISGEGGVAIGSDHISIGSLENGAFSSLENLTIGGCTGLKPYLLTLSFAMHCLPNIENIVIWICDGLEEIISEEEEEEECLNDQSSENKYSTIVLPKLWRFSLYCLPNLRRIYRGRMVCPSLEWISIIGCPMLKRLPFSMQQQEGRPTDAANPMSLPCLKEIEGDTEWWNSLEWEHPNDKSVLEPFFC